MKKLFLLAFVSISLISCQFQETMILNEDGTGRMSLSMDLSEMMAFSGEFGKDSTETKQDTIITFKDIFEEKKDSIAKLSRAEQKKLKAMENYKIRIMSDPDAEKMLMDVFTDFKDVSEANELMRGYQQAEGFIPGSDSSASEEGGDEEEPEIMAVAYEFKNNVFKRDAYIIDEVAHKRQIDSMKQAEAFMSSMKYKIKYTFPRKIKSTSVEDATFSLDGKTMELERSFLDYFKDPDVLDVEVELEN
ncbi:hypothetical protein J1N09_10265 [Aureitalea sp. L0-47]|uniref:hypothetical protein n=1 Tax=Aureitalea sp. L0-47 TaxID=2816962 RepID=UPI002238FD73|nr:hypothetical protein [Aureitalea sp. L0-47]MCW5520223.1 hypothetical protein [Aureitalea sp. L0-47]